MGAVATPPTTLRSDVVVVVAAVGGGVVVLQLVIPVVAVMVRTYKIHKVCVNAKCGRGGEVEGEGGGLLKGGGK